MRSDRDAARQSLGARLRPADADCLYEELVEYGPLTVRLLWTPQTFCDMNGVEGEYPRTGAVVSTTLGSGSLGLLRVGETFTRR